MVTETALSRNANNIVVAVLLGFLFWIAVTLVDLQKEQSVQSEKINQLNEKAKEIVPRSENERRWQSLEAGQAQNSERIGRTEQYIFSSKH